MSSVYKEHACKNRVLRTFTREEWDKLEFGGEKITEDETGKYRLEMRHCPWCNSTLGVETKLDEAVRARSGTEPLG